MWKKEKKKKAGHCFVLQVLQSCEAFLTAILGDTGFIVPLYSWTSTLVETNPIYHPSHGPALIKVVTALLRVQAI